jgi:hypothetical protein
MSRPVGMMAMPASSSRSRAMPRNEADCPQAGAARLAVVNPKSSSVEHKCLVLMELRDVAPANPDIPDKIRLWMVPHNPDVHG